MFYQRIIKLVHSYKEVSYLSSLIENNRIVVLKPFFQMKGNETARKIAYDIVKDYFEHYKILMIKKSTSKRFALQRNVVLIQKPLAMLHIPSSHEEYLKAVGAKTRNMIRKAEKQGYEFREFVWNERMDEIFDINTSKEVRSAGPMHGWYIKPVEPRYHSKGEQCYWKYYGIFKNDRLWAYSNLIICGNLAIFKHFIGHGDHLKHGIMNYLLSAMVREYIAHPHLEWLNYDALSPIDSSTGSAMSFKKHVGFNAYAGFLNLENDIELVKYSKRTWLIEL